MMGDGVGREEVSRETDRERQRLSKTDRYYTVHPVCIYHFSY